MPDKIIIKVISSTPKSALSTSATKDSKLVPPSSDRCPVSRRNSPPKMDGGTENPVNSLLPLATGQPDMHAASGSAPVHGTDPTTSQRVTGPNANYGNKSTKFLLNANVLYAELCATAREDTGNGVLSRADLCSDDGTQSLICGPVMAVSLYVCLCM